LEVLTQIAEKYDHSIGFQENRQIFHRKFVKTAKNNYHNIGPLKTVLDLTLFGNLQIPA
jgi:hypothetical protein